MRAPVRSRLRGLWRNLRRKARVEEDLDHEVRGYLDQLTDEKIAAGMDPEEAGRAARIELGGVEQVKERVREVRAGALLDQLLQDLRYGLRSLARNPGFTAVAVAALALGIGANTAIFSVVQGVLLRPLPFPDPHRLAMVYMRFTPQGVERGTMSLADYADWRAGNRAFEEPSLFRNRAFDLAGGGDAEQVMGASVTAGFFSTLGARPLLGRAFLPGEDGPASDPTLVLGEALWRRRFGADPAVLGRSVDLGGTRTTVIGVMPSAFRFPRADTQLWASLRLVPPARRGPFFFRGLARLKPGVTLEQAQAETNAIGRRIELANADTYTRLTLPVVPLREALVGNARPALLVLLGAVALVLLIAALNVASLLLARAAARQREMSIRLGLGAGRARLVRQLLTESVLLAGAGGAAGLLVASGGIRLLRDLDPGNLPRIQEIELDGGVLAFAALVSLATGVLFGLAPALQSARSDPSASLREGARAGGAGPGRRRLNAALVVAEVALSLVLLVGAGLLLRSFVLLQRVEPGFQAPPRSVVTLQISPSAAKYPDDAAGLAFYARVLELVRQAPGVQAVALADSLPPDRQFDADTFVVEGQDPARVNPAVTVPLVSADYFRSLGIPLLKGRYFTDGDTAGSPPVTILSETMARRCFPDRDPIGQRIKQSGPGLPEIPYMEIVGVVGDAKYQGLDSGPEAAYYLPYTQSFSPRLNLVVRSAVEAAGLGPSLARQVRSVDPDVVVSEVATMEEAISRSVTGPRFRTVLLGLFAGVALSLAAIGLYGVIACSVAQRGHEIGVRMALGAHRGDVLRLVIGQGVALALAGIVLGLAGSLLLTRMLSSLLFTVRATDPLTFAAVSLLLAGVALVASLVPARRATRIDPMTALRCD